VALAFENPLNDPSGRLAKYLEVFDWVTTTIFTIEVVIKMVAYGFYFNGPKSYIRNVWHIVDFLIVVTSIISLMPVTIDLNSLKVIRMIRLLRPLRVISRNENLKLSIQALVVSVPAIVSLMVIVLLVMLIFGIIAVNMFKGKSFYCETSHVDGLSWQDVETLITTDQDCRNYGGTWTKYHHHFDNIGNAMTTMIVMAQTVNWAPIMYRTMNSRGPFMTPGYKESPFSALFFLLFIIFGAFVFMNLFVGVVISAYNRESERLGKHFLLTKKQQ